MDLCWACNWFAYVNAFLCLSSHNDNKDSMEFWCWGEVPICLYFWTSFLNLVTFVPSWLVLNSFGLVISLYIGEIYKIEHLFMVYFLIFIKKTYSHMCGIVPIQYTWTLTLGISLLKLGSRHSTWLVCLQLFV